MGVGGDGGLELEDGEVGGEPGVGRPGVVRVRGYPPDSSLLTPGLCRVKAEVLLTKENLEEKDEVLRRLYPCELTTPSDPRAGIQ